MTTAEQAALEQAAADRPLRADAARNRERILAAAAEVFATRGLEASLDDIAAHAELGVGTVYRRFANREELIEALFKHRLDHVAALATEATAHPDSWFALTRLFEVMGSTIAADQGLFEAMICRPESAGRAAVRERMLPIVGNAFARAEADGHLRADASPTDFPMLLRMISAVADFTREVRPDLWRRYVAIFLDGLRADRTELTPLPEPPIDPVEVDEVRNCWRSGRR
ncbi:MAG: TetR/AcrR family transcriptional regulator [Sporichthyaceae bacterium]